MPKVIDFEDNKREIVVNAMGVFAERSYFNTTLVHIAKSCKMGRTTLYQYFKNKDEIFIHVIDKIFDDLEKNCLEIAQRDDLTSKEKIKLVFHHFVSSSCHEPKKAPIIVDILIIAKMKNHHLSNHINEKVVHIKEYILSILKEGLEKNEVIAKAELEIILFTVFSLMESVLHNIYGKERLAVNSHIKSFHSVLDSIC